MPRFMVGSVGTGWREAKRFSVACGVGAVPAGVRVFGAVAVVFSCYRVRDVSGVVGAGDCVPGICRKWRFPHVRSGVLIAERLEFDVSFHKK